MATSSKVPFSKLGLKKQENVLTINIAGHDIEVKQYLPSAEKLKLISQVLNNSLDDNSFINPLKLDILTHLEIIYRYTNITFTEKQKEDVTKLYDLLNDNEIISQVILMIPDLEYSHLIEDIETTVKAYYEYKNSALGILETISTDYSNLKLDAESIKNDLANPENLALVKSVMEKMG